MLKSPHLFLDGISALFLGYAAHGPLRKNRGRKRRVPQGRVIVTRFL
jgi:hypothetical protein